MKNYLKKPCNMRLACENVTVSYHRNPALHHITCDIRLGTSTAVVGPNGAGKSTFLKTILGEVRPDAGRVIMQGLSRCDIAYLPQVNLIDHNLPLTVADVVGFGNWYNMGLFGKTTLQDETLINDALTQVGLHGFNLRYVQDLSSGQLQRVLLARIIVQQAKVIILDEPFNAVDSKTIIDMLGVIKGWCQSGKTVVAVLHDLSQVVNNFEYSMLLSSELIAYGLTKNVLCNDMLKRAYNNNFMWLNHGDICNDNDF